MVSIEPARRDKYCSAYSLGSPDTRYRQAKVRVPFAPPEGSIILGKGVCAAAGMSAEDTADLYFDGDAMGGTGGMVRELLAVDSVEILRARESSRVYRLRSELFKGSVGAFMPKAAR